MSDFLFVTPAANEFHQIELAPSIEALGARRPGGPAARSRRLHDLQREMPRAPQRLGKPLRRGAVESDEVYERSSATLNAQSNESPTV